MTKPLLDPLQLVPNPVAQIVTDLNLALLHSSAVCFGTLRYVHLPMNYKVALTSGNMTKQDVRPECVRNGGFRSVVSATVDSAIGLGGFYSHKLLVNLRLVIASQ
jgi:hypothetical protein